MLNHIAVMLWHAVLLDAGCFLFNVHQSVITCMRGREVVVLGAGNTTKCGGLSVYAVWRKLG